MSETTSPGKVGSRRYAAAFVAAGILVAVLCVALLPLDDAPTDADSLPPLPAPAAASTVGDEPERPSPPRTAVGTDQAPRAVEPAATAAKVPAEFGAIQTLGELSPEQKITARSLLLALHRTRCAALDGPPDQSQEGVDEAVARARLLRNVEVSLAAIDAFDRGLYAVVSANGPAPPLIADTERIMFSAGGRNQGQRSNIVLLMPHSRYPATAAVKDHEARLLQEQRRQRILAFNLRPPAERRELRAKFVDRERLTPEEWTRLCDILPFGTAWDDASATISEGRMRTTR